VVVWVASAAVADLVASAAAGSAWAEQVSAPPPSVRASAQPRSAPAFAQALLPTALSVAATFDPASGTTGDSRLQPRRLERASPTGLTVIMTTTTTTAAIRMTTATIPVPDTMAMAVAMSSSSAFPARMAGCSSQCRFVTDRWPA